MCETRWRTFDSDNDPVTRTSTCALTRHAARRRTLPWHIDIRIPCITVLVSILWFKAVFSLTRTTVSRKAVNCKVVGSILY